MIARKTNEIEMRKALNEINKKYKNNIRFKLIETTGKNVHFTLTVNNSRKEGARLSAYSLMPTWTGERQKPRHIAAACYHVHGDFFDALFNINPNAEIVTTMGGRRIITKEHGNWEDTNIGSQMFPVYASDACDCGM